MNSSFFVRAATAALEQSKTLTPEQQAEAIASNLDAELGESWALDWEWVLNLMFIPLTKGLVAIVDAADYEALAKFKWHALWSKNGKIFYATRTVHLERGRKNRNKTKHVLMHREIMKPPDDQKVDHIDHDGLHDWRRNMRLATTAQNRRNEKMRSCNTSGLKGVSYHKATGKFQASIGLDGKLHYLGLFVTAEAAHAAYVEAAKRLHGEFANPEGKARP